MKHENIFVKLERQLLKQASKENHAIIGMFSSLACFTRRATTTG